MVNEVRKTYANQTDNGRTGRTDQRPFFRVFVNIFPGDFRDDLRSGSYLKNIVKAHVDQGGQYDVDIIQIVELAVQRRCRKSHGIFKIAENIRSVIMTAFCMMGTNTHTFAAVDAKLAGNHSFAVTNTNCLCRTALNAVDTAVAQFFI